jgi:phage tail-like protein
MPNVNSESKTQRAFGSGRFTLELGDGGGKSIDLLVSVDGGNFTSERVGEQFGTDAVVESRYPGRQKFEDITLTVGTSMSKPFWDWVSKSVSGNYERKNGTIVTYDFDGKERARRTFYDALIAEVQFPTLDAKVKSPAFITVKISPERMEWKAGDMSKAPRVDPTVQKKWTPCNFRVRVDGFDNMNWVQKVDGMSVKQNIIMNPIGDEKYVRKEIGRIDYPGLTFYISETYSKPFLDYWKSFVGDMEHDPSHEHTGTIEYLSSDFSKTLMTINIEGIGISAVTFDKHDAQVEQIRMIKVDCYTEKVTMVPGAGTT